MRCVQHTFCRCIQRVTRGNKHLRSCFVPKATSYRPHVSANPLELGRSSRTRRATIRISSQVSKNVSLRLSISRPPLEVYDGRAGSTSELHSTHASVPPPPPLPEPVAESAAHSVMAPRSPYISTGEEPVRIRWVLTHIRFTVVDAAISKDPTRVDMMNELARAAASRCSASFCWTSFICSERISTSGERDSVSGEGDFVSVCTGVLPIRKPETQS